MEKVPLAAVFAALRAKWPAPRVKALVVAMPRDLERNDQWPDGPWPGVAKTVEAGAAAVREYGPSTDPSFLKNVDVAAVAGRGGNQPSLVPSRCCAAWSGRGSEHP